MTNTVESKKKKKYSYSMQNLTCAHCGSMIEEALNKREEFSSVKFSFATKKLVLEASESYAEGKCPDSLGGKIRTLVQEITDSIEDGINVVYLDGKISGPSCCEGDQHEESHSHASGSEQRSLIEAGLGFILLLVIAFTNWIQPPFDKYTVILAFAIIGRHVLLAAFNNLRKGRWMDENFLMAVATIGAIAIGDYREALGVMLFYRIGVIFEERATEKSRTEIMSVIDMRPENVTLVDDKGFKREIPAADAEVGQIVQVRAGDRIPLDGVVVSGESRIDTSPVTGEPKPVSVEKGSSVISGCINVSGTLQVRIEKLLEESFVTKILDAVETATANKPSVDRFITRFAKYYTPIVMLVTILTILIPGLITGNWVYWIYTGLTFLVISCPCALVLSVPLAFFAGIGGSSKLGILFKGGISMENMKTVKVVAMDKTGTLTEGKFAVQDIEVANGFSKDEVLRLCASSEKLSSHPIAMSIREKADILELKTVEPKEGQEFAGEGLRAEVEGKSVLCGNRRLFDRLNIAVEKGSDLIKGASEVYVAVDNVFAGRIVIRDILKADAMESVKRLQDKGYIVAMVTGDSIESAEAIAKEAGITHVYADLMPTDKLNVIHNLREEFGPVMFVGDGINDAPVLAGANVGCAMGSGADAALEAADVVFMNSETNAVVNSITMAHKTMAVAWQNVIMAIAIKLVVMVFGFVGYASLWLAIFADTGVMIVCVLNAIRLLYSVKGKKNSMTPSAKAEEVVRSHATAQ